MDVDPMAHRTVPLDRPATSGGGNPFARVGRAATIWLLRSPMRRLLGGSITVIGYRGRVSGRWLATPVEYVRDGSRITILVADADRKQWWRNVRDSGDVTLLLDGRERAGSATVLAPPESDAAMEAYVAVRPRAARATRSGARMVVVDLADVAA